jgi:exodeoxyribonuclease III
MRIATWNVNSIRQRMDSLTAWLAERQPDIVCLQEIKCTEEAFPREPLEALGYQVKVHGQKTWNGVALLSKLPVDEVKHGLDGDDGDVQARFLEAVVSLPKNQVLRVVSLYLPNGNPAPGDKYSYKLKWMDRLIAFSLERLKWEEPMLLAGDFNVIPEPRDAKRPDAWVKDALFLPPTREKFRALLNLGLTDAIRAGSDAGGLFTFWDYQAGAYAKDDGIRIDHLLLSPQAADRLRDAGIDRHVRGWDKPSDHVPVWVEMEMAGY